MPGHSPSGHRFILVLQETVHRVNNYTRWRRLKTRGGPSEDRRALGSKRSFQGVPRTTGQRGIIVVSVCNDLWTSFGTFGSNKPFHYDEIHCV